MKLVVVVLSIAVSAVALSSAQLPKLCPYPDLSSDEYGKLTYCWAQEAIGVPEAHALLKSFNDYTTPRIGIFDVGFEVSTLIEQVRLSTELTKHLHLSTPPTDAPPIVQDVYYIDAILRQMGLDKEERDTLLTVYYFRNKTGRKAQHGTAVAHLLSGKSPFGVSAHGEIDFLFLMLKSHEVVVDRETRKVTLNLEDVIYRLGLVIDSLPDIVNQSASLSPLGRVFTPPEIQAQYAKIAQKTLLVTSAGNGFPEPMNSGKRELYDKIIIVCSVKPSGDISSFSPYNDKTTICAPSNTRFLQTTGEKGSAFGGTSGASPLVAGALADVMSILPTLTVSEARQMLQKTAIISRDDTAVLNYYKLIEVAIKLANIGWPKHREQIFTDDLYDFTAESQQYLASDNTSEAQAFANLRRAFFLQPDNSAVREKLAEIYTQAGYETQALFYGNDSVPPRDNREYDYLVAIADADIEKLAQILAVPDAKDFYNQIFITQLIRELSKNDRQAVVKVLKENQIEIRTVFDE